MLGLASADLRGFTAGYGGIEGSGGGCAFSGLCAFAGLLMRV